MESISRETIKNTIVILGTVVNSMDNATDPYTWKGKEASKTRVRLSEIMGANTRTTVGALKEINNQLIQLNEAITYMENYRKTQAAKSDLEFKMNHTNNSSNIRPSYLAACSNLEINKNLVKNTLKTIKRLSSLNYDVTMVKSEYIAIDFSFVNSKVKYLEDAKSNLESQYNIVKGYDYNALNGQITYLAPFIYYLEEPIYFSPYVNNILSNLKVVISYIELIIKRVKVFLEKIENFETGKEVDLTVYSGKREENTEYVVQNGDNIEEIAESYGVSVSEIYELNSELRGTKIKEGQAIIIPGKKIYESQKIKVDDSVASLEENKDLTHIGSYKDVKDSNWSIDCEQTDLGALSNPLKGTLTINSYISPEVSDSSYEYDRYVNSGSYKRDYGRYHKGTDFRANNDTVYSISDGIVLSSEYSDGCGNMVVVLNEVVNDNGSVDYYVTRYQHLSSSKVKAGDVIKSGQQIAVSGSTGGVKPHLHVDMAKTKIPESAMKDVSSASQAANIARSYVGSLGASNIVSNSYVNLGSYYTETGTVVKNTTPKDRGKK